MRISPPLGGWTRSGQGAKTSEATRQDNAEWR